MSMDVIDVADVRVPLAQRAYELLRQRILNAELQPGAELTAKALSSELGIGLTPIREALGRLDSEGLVLTEPRHCYVVAPLTPVGARELIELYGQGLEVVYALLFERADDAELADIAHEYDLNSSLVDSTQNPVTPMLLRDRSRASSQWLTACCRMAHNERLGQFMVQLSDEMHRLRALIARDLPPEAIPMLAAISEALAARDLEAIRIAVRRYLTMMQACVLEMLERHPGLTGSPLGAVHTGRTDSAGQSRSVPISST